MSIWAVSTYKCYEHLCVNFVWTCIFISFGYTPRGEVVGLYSNVCINFLRSCYNVFQSGCIFTFLPAMYEGSNFLASLAKLVIVCLFLILVILVKWYFIVTWIYIPDDYWSWAFHVLIGHVYVYLHLLPIYTNLLGLS